MEKNNRFIDSLIISAVLFVAVYAGACIDYVTQGISWLYIPQVRLIAHAVAALVVATFFTSVMYWWMVVITEILGIWISVVTSPFKRNGRKVRKLLRKGVYVCMACLQPYMGTIIYIAHSYEWEIFQAAEFNRQVQLDQFLVDVIFAIMSAVIWKKFFAETLPFEWYEFTAKEIVIIARNIRTEIDNIEYVNRKGRILGHVSRTMLRVLIAIIPFLVIFATVFLCKLILNII